MPYQDANSKQFGLFQRIRYSIFPGTLGKPKDREGFRLFFNSLVLHFRPRTVPARTLRFTLTWGLGGMAVVLILLLFGTGLLLKFIYQPFMSSPIFFKYITLIFLICAKSITPFWAYQI